MINLLISAEKDDRLLTAMIKMSGNIFKYSGQDYLASALLQPHEDVTINSHCMSLESIRNRTDEFVQWHVITEMEN
jgi:hypothetical protein